MSDQSEAPAARYLPSHDYAAIRRATHELVEAAGGCVEAARETRVGPSYASRYGNPHEAMFAPVDVIADWEAKVGDPILTRVLAAMAGYQLVRMNAANDSQTFHHHLATVSERAGASIAQLAKALEDMKVSPQESRDLDRFVGSTIAALCELQHDLKKAAG